MPHAAAGLRFSLLAAMLLAAGSAAALSEFGIEGMGVVSTGADEGRASISPDGHRIVWASRDRAGGTGGWDLWQARRIDGRWQQAQPLARNTAVDEIDPVFSADGRWLYFASNRPGGRGGYDLYRAAVHADGEAGDGAPLGAQVNSAGNESSPAPSRDGRHLMLASDGLGGSGGRDLQVARWDGEKFVDPRPLVGVNTEADEFDAAWLHDGGALVFARSSEPRVSRLFVARCDGVGYEDVAPLSLSFNTDGSRTHGAAVDWHAPGELLVTGAAPSPRAGQRDIYRMKAPAPGGVSGCVGESRR